MKHWRLAFVGGSGFGHPHPNALCSWNLPDGAPVSWWSFRAALCVTCGWGLPLATTESKEKALLNSFTICWYGKGGQPGALWHSRSSCNWKPTQQHTIPLEVMRPSFSRGHCFEAVQSETMSTFRGGLVGCLVIRNPASCFTGLCWYSCRQNTFCSWKNKQLINKDWSTATNQHVVGNKTDIKNIE